jgi:hypothetical protein
MGDILSLNASTVTVTNPGDVAPDVWAGLCDAVGHLATGAGASHIELPIAAARSWLWWFATGDAGAWRWDSSARDRLEQNLHNAGDLESVLALETDVQAVWPDEVAPLETLGLTRTLTAEQLRDTARMIRLGGGANFSVPGAGKTTMAYAMWRAMQVSGQIERCIVVAPLPAHEAWETEPAAVFDPSVRPGVSIRPRRPVGDVVVVNYEMLENPASLSALVTWCATAPTLVIFDEAHRVKAGRAGVRGQAARTLSAAATRRLVMTGTPRPNTGADLINILELAYPGRGAGLAASRGVPLKRAFVRVTKIELHLPPLVPRTERVPMSPAHDRVYDAMTDAAARAIIADPQLANDVTRAGRVVMLLLQAATDPTAVLDFPGELAMVNDRADTDLEQLLRGLPDSFTPTKFVRVAQAVRAHQEQGTKVVVWACFKHHIARLERLLAPFNPACVHGGVPVSRPDAPTDRVREIDRFRHDPSCVVLIATPHTLGEGISLHTTTTHQIHIDRPFNAGMFLQSLDRTHRLGLPPTASCTATYYTAMRTDGSATIDDVVASRLDVKVQAMALVLDDPNLADLALPDLDDVLSADEILLGPGRAADLAALFAHLLERRV